MRDTYALLGHPLRFSLSPAMHAAAFEDAGLDATYVLRPTPAEPGERALREAFEALRAGRLAGANVTVPHKVAARHLVEDESGVVTRVGAVNTIVRRPDGLLCGENTDASGFLHVLRGMGLDQGHGRLALLLGAGGAARAVAGVLLQAGWRVTVLNRSTGRAAVLASHMIRHFHGAVLSTGSLDPDDVTRRAGEAALVVNATPIGAAPAPDRAPQPTDSASPWPLDRPWPAELALIDLVAWPTETVLVHHARAAGAPAEGGLGLLVAQAAASFRLWTGRPAPLALMRAAAEAEITRQRAPRNGR
jgi:shikimate dehydrogenase